MGTAGEEDGAFIGKKGGNHFFFCLEIWLSALFQGANGKSDPAGSISAAKEVSAQRGEKRRGCGKRSETVGAGQLAATCELRVRKGERVPHSVALRLPQRGVWQGPEVTQRKQLPFDRKPSSDK